jgi:hypothetical protein
LTFHRNEPLQLWASHVPETSTDQEDESSLARIERVADDLISSTVIELVSPNLSNTYITCPAQANRTLGIKLPFLVLIVKNLNKYFSFEVEVLDDKEEKRRFRASNYQVLKHSFPLYLTVLINDTYNR